MLPVLPQFWKIIGLNCNTAEGLSRNMNQPGGLSAAPSHVVCGTLGCCSTGKNQPGVFCTECLQTQFPHKRMQAESRICGLQPTDNVRVALFILDIVFPQRQ